MRIATWNVNSLNARMEKVEWWLKRARLLVLAGSIMGGDISVAADEIRAVGIPIISLNMVGSITEHVDLVVSDPVQAGTMAVMAIADTAAFDLDRQRGRKF